MSEERTLLLYSLQPQIFTIYEYHWASDFKELMSNSRNLGYKQDVSWSILVSVRKYGLVKGP